MPKRAFDLETKLNLLVEEFGDDKFTIEEADLVCKICNKKVNSKKKYFVTQHIGSENHQKRLQLSVESEEPSDEPSAGLSSRERQFSMDLCRALVKSNIPLHKVQNKSFKDFLEKYCKEFVPDHSTLRKTYLKKLYDETIENIRRSISEDNIWVSIDETTDAKGQYVVNTVIGSLNQSKETKPYLLSSEIVEKTNHATIAQAFVNAMQLLWPEAVKHERVLLFVTDAASYMQKAANGLSVLFPKMVHVTCVAHGLHRVCEEIRNIFPDVNSLISNAKKIFLKAPSRIQVFRDRAPHLQLPPEPIITRWGTWIEAALYYAENFEIIKEIIFTLNPGEASAIKESQDILIQPGLQAHLAFIAANFSKFPVLIKKLECTAQTLATTIRILHEARECVESIENEDQHLVNIKSKFSNVIEKNSGLNIMFQISMVLENPCESLPTELHLFKMTDIISFKYAPLVSVDVERSFSQYKLLLTDRRHLLTPENAKYHLVTMCN